MKSEVVTPKMSLKQFLFLRKDLKEFTTGMLVAQGCHASIAALEKYRNTPQVIEYLSALPHMTTVIYRIKESEISEIEEELKSMKIGYHIWVENCVIPTCIATWPIDVELDGLFKEFKKKFRLF